MEERTRLLSIPRINGDPLALTMKPRVPLVIVGANGSGKSALASYIANTFSNSYAISGHRYVTMPADGIESAGKNLARLQQDLYIHVGNFEARWNPTRSHHQVEWAISELIEQDNRHARDLRDGLDPEYSSPLATLNHVLRNAAGFDIQLQQSGYHKLDAVRQGVQISPARLSDGERAAILLAAEVLTHHETTIHVLDEPELHLHRRISAPLIRSLIEERPRDYFILLTHDLDLAADLSRGATSLVVHDCTWSSVIPRGEGSQEAEAWELDELPPDSDIPDSVRQAVLGGRRRLLLHEGTRAGLDHRIYAALFPEWFCVPMGSCGEVIRGTSGLGATSSINWITAQGIIDRDYRSGATPNGVLMLGVHEIENVLFLDDVLKAVAVAHSTNSDDPDALYATAKEKFIEAMQGSQIRELAVKAAKQAATRSALEAQVQQNLWKLANNTATISASVTTDFEAEYDKLLTDSTLDDFLVMFSAKNAGMRDSVARALQLNSRDSYEKWAIDLLSSDDQLRATVIKKLGLDKLITTPVPTT